MGSRLLVSNARVLDVATGRYSEGTDLLMSQGSILEVGEGLTSSADTHVIDATGLVVMPGLIDAHVHVTAATADLGQLPTMAPSYVTAHSARIMLGMLERGFTTVRDMGGADHGLVRAQREGLLPGPRILHCGHALSQTGGHGDFRRPGQTVMEPDEHCAGIGRVVDGVEGVRAAARDELRKGADFLKVMASGGVASPTDRIDSTQYSISELQAVVEEASASNRYVAAHAYTARAVNRALEAGVRSIEHGNLIDDTSLQLLVERQAFLVPTLVTYWALKQEGLERGLPRDSWNKVDTVLSAGLDALRRADEARVKIAFGTDLLAEMHVHQPKEFQIRSEVQPILAVVQSATNVAAELIGMSGLVGCLSPGAHADAIILDADPLENIDVLAAPERHLRYVIQSGHVVVDRQGAFEHGAAISSLPT
jgi:imidazolonepropionase-like amidohydrolase